MVLKLLLVAFSIAATAAPEEESTIPEQESLVCDDSASKEFCNDAFEKGYCSNPDTFREMKAQCAKTCGHCDEPTLPPQTHDEPTGSDFEEGAGMACLDRASEKFCNDAFEKGNCNNSYVIREMRTMCAKTCGHCDEPTLPPQTHDEPSESDFHATLKSK